MVLVEVVFFAVVHLLRWLFWGTILAVLVTVGLVYEVLVRLVEIARHERRG